MELPPLAAMPGRVIITLSCRGTEEEGDGRGAIPQMKLANFLDRQTNRATDSFFRFRSSEMGE